MSGERSARARRARLGRGGDARPRVHRVRIAARGGVHGAWWRIVAAAADRGATESCVFSCTLVVHLSARPAPLGFTGLHPRCQRRRAQVLVSTRRAARHRACGFCRQAPWCVVTCLQARRRDAIETLQKLPWWRHVRRASAALPQQCGALPLLLTAVASTACLVLGSLQHGSAAAQRDITCPEGAGLITRVITSRARDDVTRSHSARAGA